MLTKSPVHLTPGTLWTERPVTVDAGVRVPQGHYQVRQAGTDGPRAVAIGGKGRVSMEDLARFRVTPSHCVNGSSEPLADIRCLASAEALGLVMKDGAIIRNRLRAINT